jgi:hypothetical protein
LFFIGYLDASFVGSVEKDSEQLQMEQRQLFESANNTKASDKKVRETDTYAIILF